MAATESSGDALSFLDMKLFDSQDFLEFIVKFAFNSLVLFILIRLLYYPRSRRRDYMFSFLLIGTIIFMLCFFLESVKLGTGMALGLFAIFGILRYRTIQISIKEMTYLFLVIGVSVINSLSSKKTDLSALIFTNFLLLVITWLIERILYSKPIQMLEIEYEKIELVRHDRRKELIADLEARTGLKIRRIEIGRINFLRDTVRVQIFFIDQEQTMQGGGG